MTIPEIDLDEALLLHEDQGACFVDIRDPGSFGQRHVPGALHLDDASAQEFLSDTARDIRIVVYCYHGHASLGATAFLLEQGFKTVESLAGGFTAWAAAGAPGETGSPGEQ